MGELEGEAWSGGRLAQAEITTATMLAYVRRVELALLAPGTYPKLEKMAADCESHLAFRACPLPA